MAAPNSNLVTLTDPRSPTSEAYRTLRTNIIFSSLAGEPLETLIVTSATPEDGKSTALANLAVTLAQGGKKTILVDCDLRRPSQHTIWGISQEPGLTSMVLEGLKVPPLCEVVENLNVLPSGPLPPNPADFLSSPRLDEIVDSLKKQADIVLFDAPPVIAVTDSALLAVKLDAVLLVMRAGATRRNHAERAKELLQRIGVRILGVALLNVREDTQVRGYY